MKDYVEAESNGTLHLLRFMAVGSGIQVMLQLVPPQFETDEC
jgi:hypothetical protein